MYRTIKTLHEYRTTYPDSAPIPTLTQSGLLGILLDRQHYKAVKLARRRAMWRSLCAAPRNVWRALTIPGFRRGANPVNVGSQELGARS
jgi:hypothetical protein